MDKIVLDEWPDMDLGIDWSDVKLEPIGIDDLDLTIDWSDVKLEQIDIDDLDLGISLDNDWPDLTTVLDDIDMTKHYTT